MMEIEKRSLHTLTPYPKNYNRHSPEHIGKLAESLRIHGQQKNICITAEGVILAGHGLVEAARSLGWQEISCKVYDGQGDPRAWLVADNYLASLAEVDDKALADLLQDLQASGDLEATGYSAEEAKVVFESVELREEIPSLNDTIAKAMKTTPARPAWFVLLCDESQAEIVKEALKSLPSEVQLNSSMSRRRNDAEG
jgi:ParB-like chromosome segregation protein Spo0J